MSLRRADMRFVLPHPVAAAAVLGGLEDWRDGLRQGGVEVVEDVRRADVVVAPRDYAAQALASGAPMLLIEGGGKAGGGYSARSVQQLPDAAAPQLLLPVGGGRAVRYALRRRRPGESHREKLRNAVAREAVAAGITVPGRPATLVAASAPGPPHAVALAAEAAGIGEPGWFASIATFAHPVSRAVFYVFAPGEDEPGWVVKFSRIPGLEVLFEQDAEGLRLAERTAGTVAAAAPRLLGRFDLGGGLHAAAETAATGKLLGAVLRGPTRRAARLELVARFADWIVDVARETAAPPPSLMPALEQLERDVVPHWSAAGLPGDVVASLPDLPSVFVHGDLNGENVFVDGSRFGVVDWESAQSHGPPVWDVLYFLADALAAVEGVETPDEHLDHFARLFLGELDTSDLLFRCTRRAADAAGLPHRAVGPLATLLWLKLGLAEADHVKRLGRIQGDEVLEHPPMWRRSERWLRDPGLGVEWAAFPR